MLLHAAPLTLSSGPERVSLLELYTSEGCSSCPPAEAWLAESRTHPERWQQVIPLVYHVHYWDYLGWRDRWSRSEFSERQYRLSERNGSSVVYTPEFFRNGTEWTAWRRDESVRSLNDESTGHLVVSGETTESALALTWIWKPSTSSARPVRFLAAVVGPEQISPIDRGENAGRVLKHDRTVVQLFSAAGPNGTGRIARPSDARSLVVWIEEESTSRVLQAAETQLLP